MVLDNLHCRRRDLRDRRRGQGVGSRAGDQERTLGGVTGLAAASQAPHDDHGGGTCCEKGAEDDSQPDDDLRNQGHDGKGDGQQGGRFHQVAEAQAAGLPGP
jgi:hypothetical protein